MGTQYVYIVYPRMLYNASLFNFTDAFVRSTEDAKKLEEFIAPLDNLALWSTLYHAQSAPFIQDEVEAFGHNQPGVRKAAWTLLQELLQTYKGSSAHFIASNIF